MVESDTGDSSHTIRGRHGSAASKAAGALKCGGVLQLCSRGNLPVGQAPAGYWGKSQAVQVLLLSDGVQVREGRAPTLHTRELRDLPLMRIPQHGEEDVEIELKSCDEPTETLGVYTSPINDGSAQLDKMMGKAYRWSDRVRSSNLTSFETWQSYRSQARASAGYGLVPLMSGPAVVEETFLAWYYDFLPKWGLIGIWLRTGDGCPRCTTASGWKTWVLRSVGRWWGFSVGTGERVRGWGSSCGMRTSWYR